VQPLAVAQSGLDRVAEGVAEIEDGAQPGLALVAADHARLDLAGTGHRVRERARIARKQRRQRALHRIQVGRVGDRAMLDHFGEPRGELALRQRRQAADVGKHQPRLVEGADHVLAQRMVDAGLAADRRVHLGQQRGGHLDEVDAPLVDGRRETGHVADHAAAQRHEDCAAVEAMFEQRIEDRVQRPPVLVRLAVGQRHLDDAVGVRLERRAQPGCVQRRHGDVADDRDLAAGDDRGQQVAPVEQALADGDGIAALGEGDDDFTHS
jgi:hypothetical protein